MPIKFLNLNLWSQPDHPSEGKLHDRALAFLKRENADIVTLQEVYNGDKSLPPLYRQFSIIKNELAFAYAYFAPAFLDKTLVGKVPHGNAIFSKFPITETASIFYDEPYRERPIEENGKAEFTPRNLASACIAVHGTEINVFTTQGIWGNRDGADNARRLAMSTIIQSATANKKNVILSGDFNTQENTKTIGNLENNLINIFRGERTTSFNMLQKTDPGFATAVVDFIFVSKDVRVTSHSIFSDDVSDHQPLGCILEIAK